MNKKIFGIKISTYLFALLAVGCAVVFWLYAKSSGFASGAFSYVCSRSFGIL